MLKKILSKIEKLEQLKQIKITKQSDIQKEIEDIDIKIKKLNTFKRQYENLEKHSKEFLNNLKVEK